MRARVLVVVVGLGAMWAGCGGRVTGECQGDFPSIVECLDRCGGKIVQITCAPEACPRGTVPSTTCGDPAPVDGGPAPSRDASSTPDGSGADASDSGACLPPYHLPTSSGCVWSCGIGTQPDVISDECVCQPGKKQTGVDAYGRRTCT